MAENIFRLKRIAKKDPFVTPVTALEKHIHDAVSEGGMPDASGLKDGTAMVAVGGKFVPVEGYGYSAVGGTYGPFYWDGVYRADDPDIIVGAAGGGSNIILKKIADDNLAIGLSSSIHILEESGGEYDLVALNEGANASAFIPFMDPGYTRTALFVRDPDAWSMLGIDSNDTGLFSYIIHTGIPSDGDQLLPPSEFTVLSEEILAAFNKKYIPTDYVTEAQVDSIINNKIISGTTEYEDGVTYLDNGVIYLQYEV